MKLGMSAFAWVGSFIEEDLGILSFVKSCGFEGFEIPMFVPTDLPVILLRRELKAIGLTGTVCAILPEGINPIDADPKTRRAA